MLKKSVPSRLERLDLNTLRMSSDSKPRSAFPCTQCGACCRHVDLAEETRFLDRGDGTCQHYDGVTSACRIYSSRPEICRVEQYYERHYVHLYSWEQFVELNQQACRRLVALDTSEHSSRGHNTV